MRRSTALSCRKIHPGSRVKFRCKVNITVHFGHAPSDRAEQRKGTQGKLQEALEVYRQSLKIRQTLAEQDKSFSRNPRSPGAFAFACDVLRRFLVFDATLISPRTI